MSKSVRLKYVIFTIGFLVVILTAVSDYKTDREIINIRDYGDSANLNSNGYRGRIGVHFATPLSDILAGISSISSTSTSSRSKILTVNCNENNISKLEKVTRSYPTYPFGYFWLALCLEINNDPNWRGEAELAVDLFKKTTSIVGHLVEHDYALNALSKELNLQESNRGILDRFIREYKN